ncbi:MAG: CoA transferase [Deltaproteobacteria bacterium]
MSLPLAGIRVVELADETGEYAGKLLGGLGAEVIKVEAPGGEGSRAIPPFRPSAPAQSYWFLYANTSKQSLVLDLPQATGAAAFRDLVAGADILVETRGPGVLESLGLGAEELHADNPRLVMARISGFGQDGPRRGWLSSDLVATALSGAAHTTGWPDEPPVSLAGYPACVMAGLSAAAGAMVAWRLARRTGVGQVVDVSLQESMAAVSHIVGAGRYREDQMISRREGASLAASIPSGVWDACDGRIYLTLNRPAHWQALAQWVAEVTGNEAILDPAFTGPSANRHEFRPVIDAWLAELFARYSVVELYAEGQRRHLAITPLNDAAAVVADAHLAARGFFARLPGGELRYPGLPIRFPAAPREAARRAPALGEHRAEGWTTAVAQDSKSPGSGALSPGQQASRPHGEDSADSHSPRSARPGEPLSGLRVLEFTAGMAGPWVGRMMAYHGADVVKIESRTAADVTRLYISPQAPEAGVSEVLSPWFTDWNAGKRFVGLDLKNADALAIAKRLAAEADVVIENFVPGVVERLGLGYEVLAAANPGLIYLATSGFGREGPAAGYVTWGPNMEAVSGLAALSGFPGKGCTITQYAYSDPVGALHGLTAVMAALDHRTRTGEGQLIDIAQMETCVATIGDVMLQALDGGAPAPQGNGRARGAPWGLYACSGEDSWCAITALHEDHWRALCRATGHAEWQADARFASFAARLEHAGELDALLTGWTSTQTKTEVMESLQAAGVPAGAVQNVRDLCEYDPQLRARDFFETIAHASRGEVAASRLGFGLDATPGHTTDTGRPIGADNAAVLAQWLGLDETARADLEKSGALEV